MPETMRVRAVASLAVARLNPRGGVLRDSWVGRAPDGSILPEGESVPRHAHYLRALAWGELELVANEAG